MNQQTKRLRMHGGVGAIALAAVVFIGLAGCAHCDTARYATNKPLVTGELVTVPIDAKLRSKPDWIGVVRTVLPQGSVVRLDVASTDGRYWRVQTQEGKGWLDADDLQWVPRPE